MPMERNSHWATDFPLTKGGYVREGDAEYCRTFGHAKYWVIDEVEQGICPRCGIVK